MSTGGPQIELDPAGTLNCGQADVGTPVQCQVTAKSTGGAALEITGVEITGPNSGDFTASNNCHQLLNPGQSCVLPVQFTPSQPGDRSATLVIHQNLPAPDHGTPLQLTGTGNGTPPPQPTLTVSVGPGITVAIVPSGIDCTSTSTSTSTSTTTCHQSFNDGTDITLTASYAQNNIRGLLASWNGCDTTSGDTCKVHLDRDKTVTVGDGQPG
jgi:hypothetical protein